MRKLVTIQIVSSIDPIEGADKIELLSFRDIGFKCIAQKGEFSVGQSVVYCEADTILPVRSEFEFLRERCYNAKYNGFRIKFMKLRGVFSEGIVFNLSVLEEPAKTKKLKAEPGADMTDVIGARLYSTEEYNAMPQPKSFGQKLRGLPYIGWFFRIFIPKRGRITDWPQWMPGKTDETRVENLNIVLDPVCEIQGKDCYATVKKDGSSVSVAYKNKKVHVASRNRFFPEKDKNNKYWQGIINNEIDVKLAKYCKEHKRELVIQGELCGPGIQGNKYKYPTMKYFVFNVYDLKTRKYFGLGELLRFSEQSGIALVPVLGVFPFAFKTQEELTAFADIKDPDADVPAEGVVIRPCEPMPPLHGMSNTWSFKKINQKFLIKYKGD